MDDVVLLPEDPSEFEVPPDRQSNSTSMSGMHFAPLNRKTFLHDWTGSKPNLVLTGWINIHQFDASMALARYLVNDQMSVLTYGSKYGRLERRL